MFAFYFGFIVRRGHGFRLGGLGVFIGIKRRFLCGGFRRYGFRRDRDKDVRFCGALQGFRRRWGLTKIEGDQLIVLFGGRSKRGCFQPTTPEHAGCDGGMDRQRRDQRGRDGMRLMFLRGIHGLRFW